jgi:hypothetical protein
MTAAVLVVVIELGIISWVRHRYMETAGPPGGSASRVGRILAFITGVLVGNARCHDIVILPLFRLRFIGSSFLKISQAYLFQLHVRIRLLAIQMPSH